jgi:TonB family protein
MSLVTCPFRSRRYISFAGMVLAIALGSAPAWSAKRDEEADSSDPLSKVKRNVVAVVDLDRSEKAVLGSGILIQRDKALVPCRLAAANRNLGVMQGQRRSAAKLIDARATRGLCALKVAHPVHFDPSPLDIRPIEEVSVGDSVYVLSTTSGRDFSMTRARVSEITGSDENKVIRISKRLTAAAGSALFDGNGALIGMHTSRATKADEAAFNYPMEYYLQVEEQKAQEAKQTTAPWEDTRPPAQLQVNAEPDPPPKLARNKPAAERSAENLAYKQAVKEYLEDIVRASMQHVVYPDSARTSHWTGTTSIWFRLNSGGGELGESFVDTSSGYATLDVAALLAVRKAITDLPAPPLVKDRGMMATVAVTFALSEKK